MGNRSDSHTPHPPSLSVAVHSLPFYCQYTGSQLHGCPLPLNDALSTAKVFCVADRCFDSFCPSWRDWLGNNSRRDWEPLSTPPPPSPPSPPLSISAVGGGESSGLGFFPMSLCSVLVLAYPCFVLSLFCACLVPILVLSYPCLCVFCPILVLACPCSFLALPHPCFVLALSCPNFVLSLFCPSLVLSLFCPVLGLSYDGDGDESDEGNNPGDHH